MIGHQHFLHLRNNNEVKVVLHKAAGFYKAFTSSFSQSNAFFGVDVLDLVKLGNIFDSYRPSAVINAIGIVKQSPLVSSRSRCIELNALFPHQLQSLCEKYGARLVNFSTDCVFSGTQGNYSEKDSPDASDDYGRTKFLGEVLDRENSLTLRTSSIGLELNPACKHGLLEWFLSSRGVVEGFVYAMYSGVTTLELARVVEKILHSYPKLFGVMQLASEPISKYDLLTQLAIRLGRTDLVINRNESFRCNRVLDGSKLEKAISYTCPSWDMMLNELAEHILTIRGCLSLC